MTRSHRDALRASRPDLICCWKTIRGADGNVPSLIVGETDLTSQTLNVAWTHPEKTHESKQLRFFFGKLTLSRERGMSGCDTFKEISQHQGQRQSKYRRVRQHTRHTWGYTLLRFLPFDPLMVFKVDKCPWSLTEYQTSHKSRYTGLLSGQKTLEIEISHKHRMCLYISVSHPCTQVSDKKRFRYNVLNKMDVMRYCCGKFKR